VGDTIVSKTLDNSISNNDVIGLWMIYALTNELAHNYYPSTPFCQQND